MRYVDSNLKIICLKENLAWWHPKILAFIWCQFITKEKEETFNLGSAN